MINNKTIGTSTTADPFSSSAWSGSEWWMACADETWPLDLELSMDGVANHDTFPHAVDSSVCGGHRSSASSCDTKTIQRKECKTSQTLVTLRQAPTACDVWADCVFHRSGKNRIDWRNGLSGSGEKRNSHRSRRNCELVKSVTTSL